MKKEYLEPKIAIFLFEEKELLTISVNGSAEPVGDLADWNSGYIIG